MTLVKAIAERDGVSMPSFQGNEGYSAAVLLPVFLAATLVFISLNEVSIPPPAPRLRGGLTS